MKTQGNLPSWAGGGLGVSERTPETTRISSNLIMLKVQRSNFTPSQVLRASSYLRHSRGSARSHPKLLYVLDFMRNYQTSVVMCRAQRIESNPLRRSLSSTMMLPTKFESDIRLIC